MDSFPTLQEFVLNLIYDPAARSAFEVDPESALHAAGLSDITAADVQQVIPLVVDSAPVTGLPGLAGGADDLTTGVANLDVAGAVSHLQAITAQVALSPAGHLNAEVTSGFSVNAAVLGVAGDSNWGGLGADPGAHLDSHLDNHLVTDVVVPVPQVDPGLHAGVGSVLDSGVDTIGHLPSSVPIDHVPSLDDSGLGGATSSIGSVITPDLGHVLSHDPVTTVHDTVSGVTGTVGDVLHGVTGTPAQEAPHGLLGDLHL
ncbi:IniB N-terminal domain-containing protein [Actinoplanes sp. L3-i22]|uniref:IniB N-terminal domain-containing protein n=1 Tax=Actinoplanes sp. L3-i22 TaxID=2836373 RepID=UPI001C772D22|nr:IniB N-terminal domain-containing protein [Actinoplanes sp. L3-i22]BCY10709.1 hypothetical protein L3i22_057970 [Actinoplanes sp. L3-i22]